MKPERQKLTGPGIGAAGAAGGDWRIGGGREGAGFTFGGVVTGNGGRVLLGGGGGGFRCLPFSCNYKKKTIQIEADFDLFPTHPISNLPAAARGCSGWARVAAPEVSASDRHFAPTSSYPTPDGSE